MRTTCLAAALVLALAAPGMASSIPDSSRAGADSAPKGPTEPVAVATLTTTPRRWNATSIVLATEAGNAALASLVFLPHGSKVLAGVDACAGFILYMAPMDTNPKPDENSALVSGVLAGGFALMAVANWGPRRIDLTDQQKFWMNVAGPHLVIGMATGAGWISTRLYRRRHPA